MITLKEAQSEKEYQTAAELFKEYASQLGIDLSFQNFSQEIENIATQYARPGGVLFIAYLDEAAPCGCFGIRKLEDAICELKRMYVRQEARGLGLGKQLLRKAIEVGKALGYEKIRLDTLPSMEAAIRLYEKEGFYEIGPYRFNPIAGTKYFERELQSF